MQVDFRMARAPAFTAVSVDWSGPWNERRIRREFEGLSAWAKERRLRTGKWYFLEPGTRRWRVAIEVKGRVRGAGRVRARKFAATSVARVQFDPDRVSPRVIYHGLNDFLKSQRREKAIKSVGSYREVYTANPWTSASAWSSMCVEAVVRR
jgi:hypothetical protein